MRNKTSILTLSLVCLSTFASIEANAQREKRRARVSATVVNKVANIKSNKTQDASDYANSAGVNTTNSTPAVSAESCGAGTYFDGTSACNACATGTWSAKGSTTCVSCGENIATCNPTNGEPITCVEGYKLDAGKCVANGGNSGDDPKTTETIKNLRQKFSLQLTEVSAACSGIASKLNEIESLNNTSTISSGIAGLAGGAALTTGMLNDHNENLTEGEGKKGKSSATSALGITQTASLAGATVASGVATGTSAGAAINANKIAESIELCDTRVNDLNIVKNALVAEIEDLDKDPSIDKTVIQANKVIDACSGKFNKKVVKEVFGTALASAITSAVGTGAAGTGTVFAVMDTVHDAKNGGEASGDEEYNKKRNVHNVIKNVAAGVVAGTGTASTIMGAINWKKLEDMKKDAQGCEDVLKGNLVDVEFETTTRLKDIPYADGSDKTTEETTEETPTENQ